MTNSCHREARYAYFPRMHSGVRMWRQVVTICGTLLHSCTIIVREKSIQTQLMTCCNSPGSLASQTWVDPLRAGNHLSPRATPFPLCSRVGAQRGVQKLRQMTAASLAKFLYQPEIHLKLLDATSHQPTNSKPRHQHLWCVNIRVRLGMRVCTLNLKM